MQISRLSPKPVLNHEACFLRQFVDTSKYRFKRKTFYTQLLMCASKCLCVYICTRSSPPCLLLLHYILFLNCICLCIITCMLYMMWGRNLCHGPGVWRLELLNGVSSVFLPLGGLWGSNSSCQAWMAKAALPPELSHQCCILSFWSKVSHWI